MSLEIASKLALSNDARNTHLRTIRIEGGNVTSTNVRTTYRCWDTGLDDNLDCLVDAATFMSAQKSGSDPQYKCNKDSLIIKNGRMSCSIALNDITQFPAEWHPDVKATCAPGNFLEALGKLKFFMGQPQAQPAYVLNGYLYCSNGYFLVRTKLDTEFPVTERPISITKQAADLLLLQKQTPTEIRVCENSLVVQFPSSWLETSFYADLIDDYETFFDNVESLQYQEFTDVSQELKTLVKAAKKDHIVTFNNNTVQLVQDKQALWTVTTSFETPIVARMKAGVLGVLLQYADRYNFSNPSVPVFRGDGIDGVWSLMDVAPVAEEESELVEV